MISIAEMSPDHEVGAAICQDAQGLSFGPLSTGGPYNVSVPLRCPADGQVVGVFHTHPGGEAVPSSYDMAEAERLGLQYLAIGVPDTGEFSMQYLN